MQKNLDLINALLGAQTELQTVATHSRFNGASHTEATEKFLAARAAVLDAMKESDSIYASLSDEEAQTAGFEISQDFGLKRSREHSDRYETESGTFTVIGIARRALRMIESARETHRKK